MAKATTVKLEAGTDLVGPIKFVDFYAEKDNPKEPGKKMAAQWGFTGTFNGDAEGRVYIDAYQLEENPVKAGHVVENGKWDDGRPRFKWVGQGPFRLHKYLKDKKAHVTLTADGGAAPAQVGNGAAGQARSTVATPSPAPSPIEQWWAEQEALMRHCYEIAVRLHGPAGTEPYYQATAHSFYIQANREGKLAPATSAEAIRDTLDSYAAMPAPLQDGPPDPELPAWMQ